MKRVKIIPFIAWNDKDKKINTEHGVVRYEVFCENEVKRMKNGMEIQYKNERCCVA